MEYHTMRYKDALPYMTDDEKEFFEHLDYMKKMMQEYTKVKVLIVNRAFKRKLRDRVKQESTDNEVWDRIHSPRTDFRVRPYRRKEQRQNV